MVIGGIRIIMLVCFLDMVRRFFIDVHVDSYSSGIRIILTLVGAYGIFIGASHLYLSFFKSPQWIELRDNMLIIKMPFKKFIL